VAATGYQIELATAVGADPATWTDITAWVKRFSFRRGRDDVLDRGQPGTATLSLDNSDGRFSPTKTSSPLYPHVDAMRAIRIRTTLSAVTYSRFFGYIQSVRPMVRLDQQECVIQLADGSAWLAAYKTTPTYGAVTTDLAVGTALNSASWPLGLRSIGNAVSSVAPAYDNATVLDQVQNLTFDNEGGIFYFDGAGRATFHGRHQRYVGAYTTSQATFNTTGALRMTDLVAERPVRDIANTVGVSYVGGGIETETDAASATAYGPRRIDISAQWLSQSEAEARAQYGLIRKKNPQDRPVVTVVGRSTALQTQILVRDLADRITIAGPATSGISGDFHIEAVSVEADAVSRVERCTWQLSAADTASYFLLDDATRGQLDDDQLAP
jgi:hypothetical protein